MGDCMEVMKREFKKTSEQHIIVSLALNTTWRCGKVEKNIIGFVKKRRFFRETSVADVIKEFQVQSTDELRDALKRLEKRRYITLTKKALIE